MLTFQEALKQAAAIQAESGSRLLDLECSMPAEHVCLVYLLFAAEWHVLGFTAPRPYDREQVEEAFAEALAFDVGSATLH